MMNAALWLAAAADPLHARQDLETSVPANWSVSSGTLAITPDHYKLGSQSLRWNWSAGSAITITNPGISAADVTNFYKHTCDFWVWNGTALPGAKLRVEFMNGSTAQYWFDYYLDHTGWRRAVRSYLYDMGKKSGASATFTSVRITAPSSGTGSLCLDSVSWVGDRFSRIRDAQNPDVSGSYSSTEASSVYGNTPDIPLETPGTAELADLATLRERWLASIKGASPPGASSVTSAGVSYSAMNITEDANGIRGAVVGEDTTDLDGWPLVLARDYAHGTATATASAEKMLSLTRHLLDQGHAANSNAVPWIWYDYVNLPKALVLIAPACDPATKARLWDYFRWNYLTGRFWTTAWERNTDDFYCGLSQTLGAILFLAPDDAETVRQLKGLKRHLERFLAFSEGSEDGIKPDGLGFHHRSHYNGYMYAWGVVTDALHLLRGTVYQVDAAAYQNLRSSMIGMMRMCADGSGTVIGYHGHSLTGRNAFSMNLPFSRDHLRRLGELGGMLSGETADPVVAAAYNRRYGASDYALFSSYPAEDPPDGFHQFNYSPLGIYRRANWVASIRAPQRYFWSSEIYAATNRYGRYQSYGALEILYHGGPSMSGEQLAGWDWNHMPGTTTIVLPDSKLVALNESEAVRSQLNFSGALAFQDGQCGLYAANFQEKAADANHNPSFVWRKSWFAFGPQIVCLGSDISNNDAADPTVTTLFQGRLATQSTPVTLDGNNFTAFPQDSIVDGATAHWLLDASGTGYWVQSGTNLRITRSSQTSANQSGSGPPTTADFAKAWLDHGTAPGAAGYEYAVFPGSNATAMTAAAGMHADASTKPYQVVQRDSGAHVVKWRADGTVGYAVFASGTLPEGTRNAGLLASSERPCLVMTRLGSSSDAWITVVDPDLNFSNTEAAYGVPDASVARSFNLTINGTWTIEDPPDGAGVVDLTTTSTTLRVTTRHGLARHLHLKSAKVPGTSIWANIGSEWNDPVNWGSNFGGLPPTNDPVTDIAQFSPVTVQPVLNGVYAVKGLALGGNTKLSGTGSLTLGSGALTAIGSGNSITLAGLTLATSQTWDVGTGALTVLSGVGGAAGAGLTKAGAGSLALGGSNSYPGTTTVNAGTLNLSGSHSEATGGWVINGGTTVNFQSGSNVSVAGGKAVSFQNQNTAHALNVSGSVSNSGALSIQAASTLTVKSGGSWAQNGSMTVAPNFAFTNAQLIVESGATFTYGGSANITLSPSLTGSGGSGFISITGGSFITGRGFSNTTALGSGSSTRSANLVFSNGGTLKLTADVPNLASASALAFNVHLGTGGGVIDTNGFSTTIQQGLANTSGQSGSLTKRGAGTLTLAGTNAHTGATTIENGTLALTGSLANTPVEVRSGARLHLSGNAGASVTVRSSARLSFDLAANPAAQASRVIGGPLVFEIGAVLDLVTVPFPMPGEYLLANAQSITGTPGAVVFPSGITGSAAVVGNSLRATITSITLPPADADTDHDGLPDLVELVLGTDPGSANAAGMGLQRTGDQLVVTFQRDDASELPGLQLFVEAGESLSSWPQVFQIGATAGTSSPAVSISENGTLPDLVTVTVPSTVSNKKFVRLKVVAGD